jgi:WD40 repeat protein
MNHIKHYYTVALLFAVTYYANAQVITLHGHKGPVTSGTFSPDGKLVRTTGDTSLRTWDATTGKILNTNFFDIYDGLGNTMYSANGRRFAFAFRLPDFSMGNYDEYIEVYDSLGNLVRTVTYNNLDWEPFLLSPDGSKIVVELSPIPEDEGGIRDVATGYAVNYGNALIGPVTYSQDNKLLVGIYYSRSSSQESIIIYNTDSAKIRDTLVPSANFDYRIQSLYFNHTNDKLILTDNTHAYLWDIGVTNSLDSIPLGNTAFNEATTAFFSPDDSLIVTSDGNSTISIWDVHTLAQLRQLQIAGTSLASVFIPGFGNSTRESSPACFSPDGTRIFTIHSDNTVRVWNAKTGALLHTLSGHTGNITSASWDSSGTHILTTSADSTAKIWGPTYTSLTVGVDEKASIPQCTTLQIYPNPASAIIMLEYQLPSTENVSIDLYNMLGQKMKSVTGGRQLAGLHDISLDMSGLKNGFYILRLQTKGEIKNAVLQVAK